MFNHPPRSTTDRNHEKTPLLEAVTNPMDGARMMENGDQTHQEYGNANSSRISFLRRMYAYCATPQAFAHNHKEYINCHTISSQDGIWDTQLPGKLFLGHSVSQPDMSIVRAEEIDISSIRLSVFFESPGYKAATACLGHLGSRVAFNVFPNSKEGALPTILSTTITLHPAAPLPDIRSVPGLEDGHMEMNRISLATPWSRAVKILSNVVASKLVRRPFHQDIRLCRPIQRPIEPSLNLSHREQALTCSVYSNLAYIKVNFRHTTTYNTKRMSRLPVQKRPRREAQNLPAQSKEFPEGYGDFVFKSSDGVVFHFPRFLLSHVSPVFKDMYAIGEGVKNQEIMTLSEDSATLEYFLRHIDPVKETPHLDWNRLAGTLQAAEKYQIDSIFKWFEREASISLTTTQYPTLPNPMLCYSLARRYALRATAKLALRQLIKCPISEIMGSQHIDSKTLKHIINLRVERAQALVEVIHTCAMKAIIAEPSWSAIVSSVEKEYGKASCRCVILGNATEEKASVKKMEGKLPELGW
ncbi:hypothetical protein CPB86DRAFT_829093, partial [Serendipita vermifera]